jgi:hypothetical protein
MSQSDNFNSGTGPFSANWTNQAFQGTTPGVASNVAANNTGGAFAAVYWSANAWNAAQTSQVTVGGTNTYVGPGVRHTDSGAGTDFYVYFSHGSLQKFVNGTQTAIATPAVAAVGDVLKLSVTWDGSTNTLTPNKNTVDGTPVTDASLPGSTPGSAGIAWFGIAATADDWVGTGEIVAGLVLAHALSVQQAVNRASTY